MKMSRDYPSRLFFLGALLYSLMSTLLSAEELPKADNVLVEKEKRTLTLLREGKVLKTYQVALGNEPLGH